MYDACVHTTTGHARNAITNATIYMPVLLYELEGNLSGNMYKLF